uniref:RING-type domain-containing protein n=1 Tax=viral metagenome TaxID=1070528 RepID=A0A6C0I0M5_9ZZZZ
MTTIEKKSDKVQVPLCCICDEKFNKTTRANIKCMYCPFEACQTCCRTYILNESIIKCMSPECGREWTRKFIRDVFPLTFITGPIKEHREHLLFQKEQALLPATQPIIEARNECKRLDKIIGEKERIIREIRREIQTIYAEKYRIIESPNKKERAVFVRACPSEECRGFLSSAWKCGVCEKWTCPDCHVVKGYTRDEEHTCDPNNVATARLLENDTKPCPKCGEGIFKIDGCDQMWCTNCKTAFSWKKGTIETRIHNPHYYEWMRRNNNGEVPREQGDIQCPQDGNRLNHHLYDTISVIMNRRHRSTSKFRDILKKVDTYIRNTIHLSVIERPPRPADYDRRNQELRVQYLANEISEPAFKLQLQRDDKRHHKLQELSELFDIVVHTVTDIIHRFQLHVEECPEGEIDTVIFNEIDRIVDYTNECLADISKTYGSTKIVLDYNIRLHTGVSALKKLEEMQSMKSEN